MKKLTTGEVSLLMIIILLAVWVGATGWKMVKTTAARHVQKVVHVVANAPVAQPSDIISKKNIRVRLAVTRTVADDQNPYILELQSHPELASLASDPNVQNFLGKIKNDFSQMFAQNDQNNIQSFAEAATLIIPQITKCLNAPEQCGVKGLGAGYATDRTHPLETILFRSLDFVRQAEENGDVVNGVSNRDLMASLLVAQNNVQIYSSEILANRNLSDQELINVLSESSAIHGPAKAAFFRHIGPISATRPQVQGTLMSALNATLRDIRFTDSRATMKVYDNLQDFGLTPDEFRAAAANACTINLKFLDGSSRQGFEATIEAKARPRGYVVDFTDLCGGGADTDAALPPGLGG